MLNITVEYRGWTLTQDHRTKLWSGRKGDEILPTTAMSGTLRLLIDRMTGPEVRECCTGEACHG